MSAATSVPAADAEAAPVLPVTVTDDSGRQVTITSASRIIPVNGDLAEVVYALGLGDNVVATDISATYPAAATTTPKIGYQRALVAETILSYTPSVILADDLAGPTEALDQLRTTGIPVVIVHREVTIRAPVDKITKVAAALGVPARGAALASRTRQQIDTAIGAGKAASATGGQPRVLALYLRGKNVQLTFGKGSGVDAVIAAAGATDVGTAAGIVETQDLSTEAIIAGRPDVLLVTTTGLESVGGIDGLLKIPGFSQTPAGTDRRVLAYEDQYLFGIGPRTGELLMQLVTDLHAQPAS